MKLDQALITLFWAIITGVVFATMKAVYDRTIVKDLKNADLIEQNLRNEVDENSRLIARIFQEMDKIKSKQELSEKTFELELKTLQRQYNEIRQDMKSGFNELKDLIKEQIKLR